jgi:hypothetical protein
MFITSEIRGDAETAVQIGLTRGKASVSNPHTTKNIICQRVSYYVPNGFEWKTAFPGAYVAGFN